MTAPLNTYIICFFRFLIFEMTDYFTLTFLLNPLLRNKVLYAFALPLGTLIVTFLEMPLNAFLDIVLPVIFFDFIVIVFNLVHP